MRRAAHQGPQQGEELQERGGGRRGRAQGRVRAARLDGAVDLAGLHVAAGGEGAGDLLDDVDEDLVARLAASARRVQHRLDHAGRPAADARRGRGRGLALLRARAPRVSAGRACRAAAGWLARWRSHAYKAGAGDPRAVYKHSKAHGSGDPTVRSAAVWARCGHAQAAHGLLPARAPKRSGGARRRVQDGGLVEHELAQRGRAAVLREAIVDDLVQHLVQQHAVLAHRLLAQQPAVVLRRRRRPAWPPPRTPRAAALTEQPDMARGTPAVWRTPCPPARCLADRSDRSPCTSCSRERAAASEPRDASSHTAPPAAWSAPACQAAHPRRQAG